MIEIKNAVKKYKTKKGVVVNALNGVSLKLSDTGMVFLLGKSGSGKSTLLNVLGGLDSIDSGEIIFRGKSAKDFKQCHYDSYRNTYVGFIFQEYNVLEELTVGANIALAIELQGRKATDGEINAILSEVDLEGYVARKPNELSGGQKQRVAIARALVKNPEVVMADEPTGALDSVTGKQVFESLKRLSRDRLVLVVSHDREFAESYADRIIELSDGEVISDTERSITPSESEETASEPICYDGEAIYIEKGYTLTEDDRLAINDYLKRISFDRAVLMPRERENKKVQSRVFVPIDEEKIESCERNDFKLIKSKLSLKNAFRLGAGGLKYKKFKLVITIFLSLVSFTLFGLADTIAAYDSVTTATESIIDSGIDYASFKKEYKVYYGEGKNDYYLESFYALLSDEEINTVSEEIGEELIGVYNKGINLSFYDNLYGAKTAGQSPDMLYPNSFSGIAPITKKIMQEQNFKFLGDRSRLPVGTDEILITDYVYDYIKLMGLRSLDETGEIARVDITSPDELIGKSISLSLIRGVMSEYKIVGIIDTGFDYSRYMPLMDDEQLNSMNFIVAMALQSELAAAQEYSCYAVAFVSESLFAESVESVKGVNDFYVNMSVYSVVNSNKDTWEEDNLIWCAYTNVLQRLRDIEGEIFWRDGELASLSDNQIMLSTNMIKSLLISYYHEDTTPKSLLDEALITANHSDGSHGNFFDTEYISKIGGFVSEAERIAAVSYAKSHISEARSYIEFLGYEPDSMSEYDLINMYAEHICFFADESPFAEGSREAVKKHAAELIFRLFDTAVPDDEIVFECNTALSAQWHSRKDVRIVGAYYADSFASGSAVISDALYDTVLGGYAEGIYAYAVGDMPSGYFNVKSIVEFTKEYEKDNVVFLLKNSVTEELSFVDELLLVLGKVFLYVGLGFALFSSLMLANFIGTSISYKKQEIGILRAIGSRSADVFRIFFAESFIIAMINYVLSLISTGVLVFFINKILREDAGLLITIISFGVRQVVVLLAISVLVAFVATFIPVRKIASMKPIDAIKNRK